MNSHPHKNFSGAALFLVMWAVLVISVSLLVVVLLVDLDLESESAAGKRFFARQLALSALAIASHPEVDSRSELLNRTELDNSGWTVRLSTENSRVNVNRIVQSGETAELKLLLSIWGLNEDEIDMLVDSLTDWVDEDDFRSINGAEEADIPLDSGWSPPENRPFIAVEEMQRVRGMERLIELKPDWMEYFSVHSRNRFDLQFVSPDVLEAFGNIDSERARMFVKVRDGPDGLPGTEDDVVFETPEDAWVALGAGPAEVEYLQTRFRLGGKTRRIESRGFVGDTSYRIESVLGGELSDPRVLSWKEK